MADQWGVVMFPPRRGHSRRSKKGLAGTDEADQASKSDRGHRKRTVLTIALALVGVGALGASSVTALGAFNAVISGNGTFTAGSIVLEEAGTEPSSATCYSTGASGTSFSSNSYSCSTIDAFGAPTGQVPGSAATTQQLTFTNVGSADAGSFTMLPGACSAAGSGSYYGNDTAGFCSHVDITIGNSARTTCYYPAQAGACPSLSNTYTLASLASAGSTTIGSGLHAGASDVILVTTELDATAVTSEDMGLQATQGFTWTLTQ